MGSAGKVRWISVILLLLGVVMTCGQSVAQAKRTPWTTSRVTGSPTPPLPYVSERAFPALQFNHCLDIATAPSSGRLFIAEQGGKIYSFPNRPDVSKADLAADLAKEIPGLQAVYALTFHPRFQENRLCYVCYIKGNEKPDGTHVAEFRVRDTHPPEIDVASEKTIITWLSGGHNGCCLKFGPDGMLYISTGDAGPANPPDPLRAGQDLTNLLSAILRIDVNHPGDGTSYRIPPDNPFVGQKDARGEIWAYGLRNPWRMSFDSHTGDLWVGDVGWELWEMLYCVQKGGNYGWAVMEGRQSTHPEWPRGPTPILPPTIDHPHSESSSITDGLTYYGTRLKELYGHHIYSDYDTGKFWAFRYADGKVVDHRELADTTHRVVGFGEDEAGEFYFLDHTAGTIHRLVENPQPDTSAAFPRRLSQTGLFASVVELEPAPGVLVYEINAQPWADHAIAQRHIAVPHSEPIRVQKARWNYPKDTVLAKTLSMEMQVGNPATRRRLETQILHFDGLDWMPYTYKWNEEQTDAVLVEADGQEELLKIVDPSAPGRTRVQNWRFASRAECQRCHNNWSGPPLAFHTPQLDRPSNQDSGSQLEHLFQLGLIDRLPEKDPVQLVDPYDCSADISSRARSYLQVNCAHCHRKHAGGAVLSQMHYDLPLDQTNMVDFRPTQGTFNIHSARVLAPGDPYRSVLWYRMAKLGAGRMPYIGSTVTDAKGLALIHDWILQLRDPSTENSPAIPLRDREFKTLETLCSNEGSDSGQLIDALLSTTSGALMLMKAVEDQRVPPDRVPMVIERSRNHSEAVIRELFERFLPPGERIKRLGTVVDPGALLALPGNRERGEQLFHRSSITCKNCHRIGTQGTQLGPDLTTIGSKYTRGQILESILEPSKRVDPPYVTYLVETDAGEVLTGLVESKDEEQIVLRDASNVRREIPMSTVLQFVPRQQSLMPELLVRELTAQQVADLLEYLTSLRE